MKTLQPQKTLSPVLLLWDGVSPQEEAKRGVEEPGPRRAHAVIQSSPHPPPDRQALRASVNEDNNKTPK